MKVLIISSSSGSHGGGEYYLGFLGQALKDMGVEVVFWLSAGQQMDLLAGRLGRIGPVLRQPYTNTYLRRLRSLAHVYHSPTAMRPIVQCWKSVGADVVLIIKQCLEDGLDLLHAADQLSVPTFCTIHITQDAVSLGAKFGAIRDWVARRCLLRFRGSLYATAQPRALDLQRFLRRREAVPFVLNGVRIPDLQAARAEGQRLRLELLGEQNKSAFLAVAVGRLEPQKNPLRFLHWARALKQSRPDLHAIWVGDGRLRSEFEAEIDRMDGRTWIHPVGWVDDVTPFYSAASVVLHPADYEGLPFALLEAMAHRNACVLAPALAADLADIPPSARIVAEPHSTGWIDCVNDPLGLDKVAQVGRDLVVRQFSYQTMAKAYMAAFKDALDAGN